MTDPFERETLRFLPDVMRFASSLERDPDAAADLVQETYLQAYRARATFDHTRQARPWLFTICRNLFLRSRQRARFQVDVEDDAELEVLANMRLHNGVKASGVTDPFDLMDFGPALEQAMAQLSEPYRVVVALVDVGDHSYHEVAKLLDIPVGTVRSRLFRGRRELQASLVTYARDAGIVPSTTSGGA